MNIVFMGTPEFSVPSLDICYDEHQVLGVFTQPDRPKGRGKKMTAPPVKEKALEYEIPVYQPEKLNRPENIEILKKLNPDCIVVVAYGQILPKEILDIPKFGCINVHGSLLPKYRGASPINSAILNGEEVTGVTTMYMDKSLDSGDMIYKSITKISNSMNTEELHDILMIDGAKLLSKTLKDIEEGIAPREVQNHGESTYAPLLKKEMGKIDWSLSSLEIHNLVRGMFPWPCAYTNYEEKVLKIFKGEPVETELKGESGEILEVSKKGFLVKTGNGAFLVKEIQVSGKKRMEVSQYILGQKIDIGIKLY